ncbi:MAG: hypothetical protein IT379_08230 [Deltaproteobacteria bacterium]|nr:hypothetical protein [Deltaproteobacteria bacterium]
MGSRTTTARPARHRWVALVALAMGATASVPAGAQQAAHRDVPAGRVTGLELGVDGALEVPAGGRLRWFVTVYEVIAHRDLRPSPSTSLSVLASFRRANEAAAVTTDAYGRAAIELDVPETLTGAFDLVIEARAPRRQAPLDGARDGRAGARAIGISRRFDVNVRVGARTAIELFVDRTTVARGATVHAWGRVIDRARGRPAPNVAVRVALAGADPTPRPSPRARASGRSAGFTTHARDGLALAPDLRTDARGMFRATLRVPDVPGAVRVHASAEGAAAAASATLTVRDADRPELVVYATPTRTVVAPGAALDVDIVVRTAGGRPVAGAVLTGLSIPPVDEERRVRATRTDARGRARVPWEPAPATRGADYRDVIGSIEAVRPGLGTGRGEVSVRVGRAEAVVTFAVEGGALVPGLPGDVFVRVQGASGAPRAGQRVSLRSSVLRADAATTDADGIAVLETRWATAAERAARATSDEAVGADDAEVRALDGCAGPTVASATLDVGAHEESLCFPVDPDATLRVRAPPVVGLAGTLEAEILRRADVVRAPVVVTLLAGVDDDAMRPVVERVIGPGASRVALAVPADVTGTVWVRARPLLGGERREVRGGGALARVAPSRDLAMGLDASADGDVVVRVTGDAEPVEGFLLALPADEGRALTSALSSSFGATPASWGDARGIDATRGDLASRTPTDVAASSVLRDGAVLPATLPTEPVAHGLLRDPWRARARFVRGRLGRVFRAIQDRVAASSPGQLDEVGVQTRAGWRFNRELLSPILAALGPEAVSGLDGGELDLDALVALDPGFSFDQVARRVTRERLLRVIVALDAFVRARGLGFEWARRGDPATWLASMAAGEVESSAPFEPNDLFDGWGRPFALRRAVGARARFRFLEPVIGWEVVSSGPDGRFATPDDFWDPFARVLAPGSVYGEAVGEETLLARLSGVEVGRATIDALATLFEVEPGEWQAASESSASSTWDDALARLEDRPTPALHVASPAPVVGEMRAFSRGSDRARLTLDREPRSYLVVAGGYTPSGGFAFAARSLAAGEPLAIETTLPTHLVVGDRLRFPMEATWLGSGPLSVVARVERRGGDAGSAPFEATVQRGTLADAAGGEWSRAEIELVARRPGSATLLLEVRDGRGTTLRSVASRIRTSAAGTLRAAHAGALVRRRATLRLDVHEDATPISRALVVSAPTALAHDPGFEADGDDGDLPARAWALATRGEQVPVAWLSRLERTGGASLLDAACAAVAWSAAGNDEAALGRAIEALRSAQSMGAREDAAALVALSPVAAGLAPSSGRADPVASRIARWRRGAWAALASERDDPGLLARFAAGLLLADRRDRVGRELYRLATVALVDGAGGTRRLPSDRRHDDDGVASTAALAIAARQIGDGALADALSAALAPQIYLAMRDDRDTSFWMLAASAMGAFGGVRPAHVTVQIDGRSRRAVLGASGVAVIPVGGATHVVTVASVTPVIARLEARHLRPVPTRTDGPLRVRLEGHVGHAFETSALELVVESESDDPIGRPVVELTLPSAALFDQDARSALAAVAGVARVTPPDPAGVLRIVLAPLRPRRLLRIPLALRWLASGRTHGLSVAAYDDTRPWRRTTLAGDRIDVLNPPRSRAF